MSASVDSPMYDVREDLCSQRGPYTCRSTSLSSFGSREKSKRHSRMSGIDPNAPTYSLHRDIDRDLTGYKKRGAFMRFTENRFDNVNSRPKTAGIDPNAPDWHIGISGRYETQVQTFRGRVIGSNGKGGRTCGARFNCFSL